MYLNDLVAALTPERYEVLKKSVELGKWPDGRHLSIDERNSALQVLIAYDARYKSLEERIGYLHKTKKTECDHTEATTRESSNLIFKS